MALSRPADACPGIGCGTDPAPLTGEDRVSCRCPRAFALCSSGSAKGGGRAGAATFPCAKHSEHNRVSTVGGTATAVIGTAAFAGRTLAVAACQHPGHTGLLAGFDRREWPHLSVNTFLTNVSPRGRPLRAE